MSSTVKWSALGTFTTAIPGAGSAPTLKNLSSGSRKLGDEIDNTSGKDTYSEWELLITPASSPAAGGYVELYFIKSADGTNYEYGDDSTDPPPSAFACSFAVRATTSSHRIAIDGIELPPCKFKPLVINKTSQGFSNVNDENILSYRTYNHEIS